MKFKDALGKQRTKAKLSQERLAEELSVSRQTISKWENGDSYPSTRHILMLADVLNCDIGSLIGQGCDTSPNERHNTRAILYFTTAAIFTLAIALFSLGIAVRFETHMNNYARVNSLGITALNTILDKTLAKDGYTQKRIIGYGTTETDGTFYIKCELENNGDGSPCAAILYFCQENDSITYKCEYLNDPNYFPEGEFYKIS